MNIITETRERFLVAISAQVPADRVAEIHFFQPIKQGGVESGVAVVVERGLADGGIAESGDTETETPDAPRIVMWTARYRLTLKGPDRGKWETNIVAEADAPLVTVEAVVRGVQRRAGDVDDATRMDGDEVRSLLEARHPAQVAGAPTPT